MAKYQKLKNSKDTESKEYFQSRLKDIELNKDKYNKQSKEEIR